MNATRGTVLADQIEAQVRAAAERLGLRLRVNWLKSGVPHAMFDRQRDGRRVLDFWPSSGRWWHHDKGQRGQAASLVEALAVAALLAERMKNEGVGS